MTYMSTYTTFNFKYGIYNIKTFITRPLYKAWWCQISLKNELWPTFPKMILGHPGVVLQSLRPIGYSVK